MKEAILAKLREIEELKLKIETRMKDGLLPVSDSRGFLLMPESIKVRIGELADELMRDSSITNPVLLSLMDGALPFVGSLQSCLAERGYRFQYTTMQVSSYIGTKSAKPPEPTPLKIPVGGRDIVVVDDVCDKGKTYAAVREFLLAWGARSVKLMALVDKAQKRECPEANPTYIGFTLSKDAFIAGMGMDYNGLLRNVVGIGVVDLSTLPTEAEERILAAEEDLNKQLRECIAAEAHVSLGTGRDAFFAGSGSGGGASAAAISIPHVVVPAFQVSL